MAIYRRSPANFVTGITAQCAYTLWTDANPAVLIPNIVAPLAAYLSVRYMQPGTAYWRAIAATAVTATLRFLTPHLYQIAAANLS